jgi:hypothetical protein
MSSTRSSNTLKIVSSEIENRVGYGPGNGEVVVLIPRSLCRYCMRRCGHDGRVSSCSGSIGRIACWNISTVRHSAAYMSCAVHIRAASLEPIHENADIPGCTMISSSAAFSTFWIASPKTATIPARRA